MTEGGFELTWKEGWGVEKQRLKGSSIPWFAAFGPWSWALLGRH